MILVILAAGLGTRYGGLKQVDSVSGNNEAIIDFSIYDAIQCGFKKVVFVVRKEILETIKSSYAKKLKNRIQVEFVCQEVTNIPSNFNTINRVKPWGTAHALLTTKNIVNDNFCVINADDFYARASFIKMSNFLQQTSPLSNNYAMIGFQVEKTLSKNGTVSRGECTIDSTNFLVEIIERAQVSLKNDCIVYLEDNKEIEIAKNTLVSMNFWGFTPTIFNELEILFKLFLKENYMSEKNEFYLPTAVNTLLKSNIASAKVIETNSNWMGVTYKEDKQTVIATISEYKKQGIYPENLWN